MKNPLDKYIVVKYVLSSYVKALLISVGIFTVGFAILEFSGLYYPVERALDLKYNSPFVIAPLYGLIALSFLCFFIGLLMYLYKYKRTKVKGTFYKAFSSILNEEK